MTGIQDPFTPSWAAQRKMLRLSPRYRCARLSPTPHRLARRLPLCDLEHHPSSKQSTTTYSKGSTYSSRSSRLSSPLSPTSPPFAAVYLQTYVLSFCTPSSFLTDGLALLPRFRLHEPRTAGVVHSCGTLRQSVMFVVDEVVEADCHTMNLNR
jgi:hypothetical protein